MYSPLFFSNAYCVVVQNSSDPNGKESFGCAWSHICIMFVTSSSLANIVCTRLIYSNPSVFFNRCIHFSKGIICSWWWTPAWPSPKVVLLRLNLSNHSHTLFCAIQCSSYYASILIYISDVLTCYDHKKQITALCSTMVIFKAMPLPFRRFVN